MRGDPVGVEIFEVVGGQRAVSGGKAAPPALESCSAWIFTGRPRSRAAVEERRDLPGR